MKINIKVWNKKYMVNNIKKIKCRSIKGKLGFKIWLDDV